MKRETASKSGQSAVVETLSDLVAINSINPEWGGPGEAEVATYVEGFFEDAGIETWSREVLPGRRNVYARLRGKNRHERILLEAHLDTVSVAGMTIPPFEPLIENGRLYGRGSCDVKGGLASMMHAIRSAKQSGRPIECDVWMAAVVDEEYLFRGVLELIDELSREANVRTGAAIVAEPTRNRIIRANKGVLRWEIVTRGKSAHSAKPHLGRNAIVDMMSVVRALKFDAERLGETDHPLLGPATLCVSQIHGGQQINFVPDRCCIAVDRRLLPGESAAEVWGHYQNLLQQLPDISVEVQEPFLADEAMETNEEEPVVQIARDVAEKLGLSTVPEGVPFGCDVTKLSRSGIPGIIFGPGSIDQAHADIEHVEIDQVIQAEEFYRTFLEEYGK